MRLRWASALLLIAAPSVTRAGDALDAYRGAARLLVISAPASDDRRLAEQAALLAAGAPGLRERDLVIIRVIGDQAQATDGRPLRAAAVRAATGLAANRFGVALVGKDGGEKFKRTEPVSTDALFKTIDAMPMRQDEMKRARGGLSDPAN